MLLLKNDNGESIELNKPELFLGSAAQNDIIIQEKGIPETCLKINVGKDHCMIESLVPSNFVRLNGAKFKNGQMLPGHNLQIGESVFTLAVKQIQNTFTIQKITPERVLEIIECFTSEISDQRDLRTLLHKVIDSLVKMFGGTDAFLFTLDKKNKPEVFVSSSQGDLQGRFSDTIVQQVLSSGEAVCIPNALSDQNYSKAQSIIDLKLYSVLCAPIRSGLKNIGLLYIGSRVPVQSYSFDDLRALKIIASIAGMVIDHVMYINEQSAVIRKLENPSGEEGFIAQSPVMTRLLQDLNAVATADITILIHGETGTGKENIAQMIHRKSKRNNQSFVAVNCSSLRGELLESELFGHKKGSFTGAITDHDGLFKAANAGTLFLDEIGEMDLTLQAKLLRALELGKIRPVGATSEESVDVRIVAATNRNLEKMVSEGTFRQDLFYRLNQFSFILPPLRERGEDILHLAYFFLNKFRAQYPHKNVSDFDPETLKSLTLYQWPGNVRELISMIHRSVLVAQNSLVKIDFTSVSEQTNLNFESATQDFQKKLISRVLASCNGNKEKAASMLELSRSTFFRYCSTLGL